MAKPIYLTQEIDNSPFFSEGGFIDSIEEEIRNIPDGEDLTAIISSPGGSVFDGFRLARAISEHNGKTKAIVTGLAASMAALLLSFFDEVEGDKNSMFMLHKARIPGISEEDLTSEEKFVLENFNQKASQKLKEKGVDSSFIDSVFAKETIKDFWLTAIEAKNIGLINEATEIKRENGIPAIHKIAATYSESAKLFYDNYKQKQMGLLTKKEPVVTRQAELKDGKFIVFSSVKTDLAKGDKVALVGSNESLEGDIVLKSGIKATLNSNNEVLEVEDAVVNEMDEETMAAMEEMRSKIAGLEERVTALEGGSEDSQEQSEDQEEATNKLMESVNALVNGLKGKKAVTDFKLPKVEGKSESIQSGLDVTTERAIGMREVVNKGKQQ